MLKRCSHCGDVFAAKYPNARLCLDRCKKRELAFNAYDSLRARVPRLETAAPCEERRVPRDMLAKLIRLCLPDQHDNSPVANEATRWLLEQRRAHTDLLVPDDFGTAPLSDEHRHDLLEILEDRYGVLSTLVTNQYPLKHWHELIGDPPWPTPSSIGSCTTPTKST